MELKINGHDDRREIVSILVDNGYKVNIEERRSGCTWETDYYVIVELIGGKGK